MVGRYVGSADAEVELLSAHRVPRPRAVSFAWQPALPQRSMQDIADSRTRARRRHRGGYPRSGAGAWALPRHFGAVEAGGRCQLAAHRVTEPIRARARGRQARSCRSSRRRTGPRQCGANSIIETTEAGGDGPRDHWDR
jgi:hypothetical protein